MSDIDQITEHFSRKEFLCKCGCGANHITKELVDRLEVVRIMYGKPMKVTSGVRCAYHNKGVGGSDTSEHLDGNAADIAVKGCFNRDALMGFMRTQFKRIGVARDFIHCDIGDLHGKPSPCLWTY